MRIWFVIALSCLLSACASSQPTTYFSNSPVIKDVWGDFHTKTVDPELRQGDSIRGIRSFVNSRLGSKTYAKGRANSPEHLEIIDAWIHFRFEGRMPVYKIELLPLNLPQAYLDKLDPIAYFEFNGVIRLDSSTLPKVIKFPARLPDNRLPNARGTLETEWTYCPQCAGFTETGQEIATKTGKLARERIQPEMAKAITEGRLKFAKNIESVASGVIEGEQAVLSARVIGQSLAAELTLLKPARQDYQAFVEAYKETTPLTELYRQCEGFGEKRTGMGFPEAEIVEEVEYKSALMERFYSCAGQFINQFDQQNRTNDVHGLAKAEERLARAGRIPSNERVQISMSAEADAVEESIKYQGKIFADFLKTSEEAAKTARSIANHRAKNKAAAKAMWRKFAADPLANWRAQNASQQALSQSNNQQITTIIINANKKAAHLEANQKKQQKNAAISAQTNQSGSTNTVSADGENKLTQTPRGLEYDSSVDWYYTYIDEEYETIVYGSHIKTPIAGAFRKGRVDFVQQIFLLAATACTNTDTAKLKRIHMVSLLWHDGLPKDIERARFLAKADPFSGMSPTGLGLTGKSYTGPKIKQIRQEIRLLIDDGWRGGQVYFKYEDWREAARQKGCQFVDNGGGKVRMRKSG